MADAITPLQLKLLRLIAEHPGLSREKLLGLPRVVEADLAYLLRMDLIREGEAGFRASHLGQRVLQRA